MNTLPRLTKGRGYKGPEPFGCFNTGFAPAIRRSSLTGRYVVGFETDLTCACRDIRSLGKRTFKVNDRPVWSFKTRKPAVAKFNELVAKRVEENQREAAEYKRNRDAARRGDIDAIMGMLGY